MKRKHRLIQKTYNGKEQFVFKENVCLDDIEALVEIKKPILKFHDLTLERRLIPKEKLREYLNQID